MTGTDAEIEATHRVYEAIKDLDPSAAGRACKRAHARVAEAMREDARGQPTPDASEEMYDSHDYMPTPRHITETTIDATQEPGVSVLKSLLERTEKATEPNRGLDGESCLAFVDCCLRALIQAIESDLSRTRAAPAKGGGK